MKRPLGFAVLAFLMACLAIAGILNSLEVHQVGRAGIKGVGGLLLIISSVLCAVGLFAYKPWVLGAVSFWAGLVFVRDFPNWFKDGASRHSAPGLFYILFGYALLAGYVHYVHRNRPKPVD